MNPQNSKSAQSAPGVSAAPRRAPDGLLIWSSGDEAAWIRKYQQWHKWPPSDMSHGSCHGKRPKGQRIASSIGEFRELHSPAKAVLRVGLRRTYRSYQWFVSANKQPCPLVRPATHMVEKMTSLVLWTPDSWPIMASRRNRRTVGYWMYIDSVDIL